MIDQKIFNLIHSLSGHYKILDLLGIFLAQYLPYLLIIGFAILLLLEKNWRRRLYQLFLVSLSVLLARGLAVEVIRFFYQKQRPYIALAFRPLIDLDFSYAFPSGHAAIFFALAMATFFFRKSWSYYFFAGAFLISLARVYVGVHWPLDVLGGAVVGIISAFVVWKILPQIR